MTETIFENSLSVIKFKIFTHVLPYAGFMTCTTTRHQGTMKILWLHLREALMPFIFINNQWDIHFTAIRLKHNSKKYIQTERLFYAKKADLYIFIMTYVRY